MDVQQSPSRWSLWKGPDGLRAGWAILLFVLIAVVITVILFGTVYLLVHFTPADIAALRSRLVPGVSSAVVIAEACGLIIATAVMSRIERRSWQDYGLRGRRAVALFGQGALCGALLMAALVGTLVLSHAIKLRPSGSDLGAVIGSGLLWAGLFIPAALVEELLFRGYPFFRLAKVKNPTLAAVFTSLGFGLVHLGNRQETILGIIQVVAVGLVFCLAVWRTQSLWWAWGAHAAWNWTQTFVFGSSNSGLTATGHQWLVSTPNGAAWLSGGATGPEGSVLSLAVLALQAWIIIRTLPVSPGESPTRSPSNAVSTVP